ncbi:hypothetical protein Pelo_5346 [Pelomyxa schiedti]|nr:hypothetical protein Pelo_5346 [Pelomyxa schiedti]
MSFAPSTGCGNVFSYVRQDRLSEILEVLEGNGYVTPLTVDMCGQTLLHHACSSNAFLCLRAMLEYTNEIDSPDRDGKTPLFVAVENGSMECVKLLCERAAALKVQLSFEPLSGMTPLHAAAVHGRVACIDLLVNDLGHSLNTLDADSRTPLQAGLEETYDPVATLFLHALGGKVNTEKYCVNPPESVFDPLVKTADSDVIFSIDDKNIYGKKSHLIKHCPFFEGMFHFRSLQGRDSQEGTKSMETIQLEVPLGGFVGFLEWSQNKSLYTITNWSTLLESWQMAEMFDLASMQEDLKIHAHSTLRSDPQPGVEYLFFTYCALKTGDLRAFVEDDTHEEKWWPGFSAQTPEAKRDLMSFCASVLRFYVPHILRCTNRDPVILLRELFESANNHQEISYNPICSKRVAEQIYNWCEGETRCTFHYTDFLLDKFPPENCRCDKYDCPSCRLPGALSTAHTATASFLPTLQTGYQTSTVPTQQATLHTPKPAPETPPKGAFPVA